MTRPDNPPAFPIIIGEKLFDEGLTMRDWFAGQAMAALLTTEPGRNDDLTAEYAYAMADALLLARKEDGNG